MTSHPIPDQFFLPPYRNAGLLGQHPYAKTYCLSTKDGERYVAKISTVPCSEYRLHFETPLILDPCEYPGVNSIEDAGFKESDGATSAYVLSRLISDPDGNISPLNDFISLFLKAEKPASMFQPAIYSCIHRLALGLLNLYYQGYIHGNLHSSNVLLNHDLNPVMVDPSLEQFLDLDFDFLPQNPILATINRSITRDTATLLSMLLRMVDTKQPCAGCSTSPYYSRSFIESNERFLSEISREIKSCTSRIMDTSRETESLAVLHDLSRIG